MPRIALILPALALFAATAGCASTGARAGGYAEEMAKLEQDCTARGGILTSTGVASGRPQTEFACTIRDGGTRLRS